MPRACPIPPSEFTPIERIFTAEQYGIEPFASRIGEAREQLIADALAARTVDDAFHRTVWRLRSRAEFEPRLVDKFLSFPARTREAHASILLLLLAYDERVRREIKRIGSRIRASLFRGYPLWLGRVGGPGVRALLEGRVRELAREVKKSRRARPALLENYAESCAALLFLDPDSSLGAAPLLDMFAARNERVVAANTIAFMRECVVHHPQSFTIPMLRIRAALREFLDPRASIADFDFAGPALIEIDRPRTLRRIDAILDASPKEQIFTLLWVSARYGTPPHRALCRYLAARPDGWDQAKVALFISDSLTPELRTVIAEHALKERFVYTRFDGARLLAATPGSRARSVATAAASIERDELVRHVLEERAGRARVGE